MGSAWGFTLLCYIFIVFWSFLTLLRTIWVILRNPLQALKKTPRNGEEEIKAYLHMQQNRSAKLIDKFCI